MFKYGEDHLTSGKALKILNGRLKAEITPETRKKVNKCHQHVLAIAESDHAVYGINTGFGPLCTTKIASQETKTLQRSLLLSHSVGVGDNLSYKLSKLMLILKAHSLCKGFSGISLEIIDRIRWHIEEDIIPAVPEQGSVGASGDLAPLSHLFLPLIGEGRVFYKGKIKSTARVFEEKGVAPVSLHPKAGLALINGTQFILAHAVCLVDKLYNCLNHSDVIAALMIEGLMASPMPFHKALHKTRPHSGNGYVANRISLFFKRL